MNVPLTDRPRSAQPERPDQSLDTTLFIRNRSMSWLQRRILAIDPRDYGHRSEISRFAGLPAYVLVTKR
jgi:hypothetical protein